MTHTDASDSPDNDPGASASEWCIRLMTDKLSHAEYDAFLAWCDEGADNRTAFDEACRAWQAIDPISTSPAMIDMRSSALKDFRKAQAAAYATRSSHRHVVLAMAASVAAIAVGLGAWLVLRSDVYTTAPAERRVVALADGSRLTLDSDTVVRVKYEPGHRRLWIEKGRAKFEVAKDKSRPFTVTAGENTVLATGTEFSVETLSREMRVVLYEGRVAVFHTDVTGLAKPLMIGRQTANTALSPGQELVAQGHSDQALVVPIDGERTLAWENGELVFDDEPLETAVERVNRYSEDKVRIGHLNRAVRVSGVYRAGDTNAFIDGVASFSGLAYRYEDGAYTLESQPN